MMFEDKVIELIDVAIDIDDDKADEIKKILSTIKLTVELGSVVGAGVSKLISTYKSDERSEAERVQALINLENDLTALLERKG